MPTQAQIELLKTAGSIAPQEATILFTAERVLVVYGTLSPDYVDAIFNSSKAANKEFLRDMHLEQLLDAKLVAGLPAHLSALAERISK